MSDNFRIESITNIHTQLAYNKNKERREYCEVSYLNKRVSSIRLIDFYRKYNNLKNKINELEEALEEYKTEVLDDKEPEDDKVFIKQVHYKTAFKNLVEAHEELVNVKVFNNEDRDINGFNTYA